MGARERPGERRRAIVNREFRGLLVVWIAFFLLSWLVAAQCAGHRSG
jgi:hypothetical protein